MGPWIALACLCALARGQLPAIKKSLVSAIEAKEVIAGAADGAAFSTDMSWALGLPSSNWAVSGWINVLDSWPTDWTLIEVFDTAGMILCMKWPVNWNPVFSNNVWEKFVNTEEPREMQKWFHVIMGSLNGSSFGVVTRKGAAYQIDITWAMKLLLTPTATVRGPLGDSNISVRTT